MPGRESSRSPGRGKVEAALPAWRAAQAAAADVIGAAGVASLQRLAGRPLIPTVLVQFYLIMHGAIFLQLREKAGGRAQVQGAS